MPDLVGQQLGNYRLIRLLGQGGFAEVYLGEHIYLDTPAAIKMLYTQLASDEVESFHAEARTIARARRRCSTAPTSRSSRWRPRSWSCRTCRSRLSVLEDQVQTLSSAWRDASLHPPAAVEHARNRFLAWTRTGAFEFRSRGWSSLRFSAILRAPVMAGIGAILLVGGVTVWELQQREKPAPPQPTRLPHRREPHELRRCRAEAR